MSHNSENTGIFRGFKTLSIMPTFTCPAACQDCGTLSSPKERTNLELETILESIRQAKELGFFNVVFTGGETTLRWKDLLQAIAYAHSLNFPTRIVTNAHWAHTLEQAGERLDELIRHGLSEINYSTGDEHTRFIPIERVINATVAAAERNFRTHIMVELKAERRVTRDTILEHSMIAALTPEQMKSVTIIESPWMPLNPLLIGQYPAGVAINKQNISIRTGCDSVLQTYTLQADGRIGSCCGLGLRVIPELNVTVAKGKDFLKKAIEDSESDFLKLWIHYKGPEKVLAWAAEKDPEIKWENMYAHHCQICQRIYKDPKVIKVIREHYAEVISDVLQSAWLDEKFIPERLAIALKA
ncbi:MAG TPA: radical SAM protein [Cyanobacteria bacterium UBA12227]|nr:radical SAM protein [Cyanobacteria bacterium UBA12227]HAX89286.1 radical SAM protein [Cyanobacteria bacterium UBA11370]HBY78587.1 radical SAM protein [Cyanobacteria bacterium UBA11148]